MKRRQNSSEIELCTTRMTKIKKTGNDRNFLFLAGMYRNRSSFFLLLGMKNGTFTVINTLAAS